METDRTAVHLMHCYQGEELEWCKYGDDDCPAAKVAVKRRFTVTVQEVGGGIADGYPVTVTTISNDRDDIMDAIFRKLSR